jgi:hypothetical protein
VARPLLEADPSTTKDSTMSSPTELTSISLDDLDEVTGGTTSTTSSDAQVSAELQNITTSIANLKSGNNRSSISQLLPLLLMAKGRARGPCPCGCGMANCMRL